MLDAVADDDDYDNDDYDDDAYDDDDCADDNDDGEWKVSLHCGKSERERVDYSDDKEEGGKNLKNKGNYCDHYYYDHYSDDKDDLQSDDLKIIHWLIFCLFLAAETETVRITPSECDCGNPHPGE